MSISFVVNVRLSNDGNCIRIGRSVMGAATLFTGGIIVGVPPNRSEGISGGRSVDDEC